MTFGGFREVGAGCAVFFLVATAAGCRSGSGEVASPGVDISIAAGVPSEYSPEYMAALQQRISLLKARYEALRGQYDSGNLPLEDVWQAQTEWDIARIQQFRGGGYPGIAGAILRLKCARMVEAQIEDASVPFETIIDSQLAANQAELVYLWFLQSAFDRVAVEAAFQALQDYPRSPGNELSEDELNALAMLGACQR